MLPTSHGLLVYLCHCGYDIRFNEHRGCQMMGFAVGDEIRPTRVNLEGATDTIEVGHEFEACDPTRSAANGQPKFRFRITEVGDEYCRCMVLERLR